MHRAIARLIDQRHVEAHKRVDLAFQRRNRLRALRRRTDRIAISLDKLDQLVRQTNRIAQTFSTRSWLLRRARSSLNFASAGLTTLSSSTSISRSTVPLLKDRRERDHVV